MSAYTFDATTVQPSAGRAPAPAGKYSVILTASEIKPGKAPTDRQATLSMKILEGPLANTLIFQNLNVLHSNPVAQQIGQERMSALCHAVGVLKITDTTQLHGRPFMVDVTVSDDGKYNEVQAFLKADGSPVTVGSATAAQAAPPAWATGAPAQPATAPAPAPAQPAPTPAPTLPQSAEKQFYVAKGGQNVTPTPIPQSQVLAQYGNELAAIQVLEVGTQAWIAGATIAPAQPVPAQPAPAAAGLPPWMTPSAA